MSLGTDQRMLLGKAIGMASCNFNCVAPRKKPSYNTRPLSTVYSWSSFVEADQCDQKKIAKCLQKLPKNDFIKLIIIMFVLSLLILLSKNSVNNNA